MPRLLSSEITYGGDLEVRFTTTFPLLTAADTAVLRVTDCAGSELAVRETGPARAVPRAHHSVGKPR